MEAKYPNTYQQMEGDAEPVEQVMAPVVGSEEVPAPASAAPEEPVSFIQLSNNNIDNVEI